MPTVGSSKIINLGLCAIAHAIFRRLFIPPEKVDGLSSFLSSSPTFFNAFSTFSLISLFLTPYKEAKNLTFCAAVISS